MNKTVYKAYMGAGKILYTVHDHCVSYDMIVDFNGKPTILNVQITNNGNNVSIRWGSEMALDAAIGRLARQKKMPQILEDDTTIRLIKKTLRELYNTVGFLYPSYKHIAKFADKNTTYIKMEV